MIIDRNRKVLVSCSVACGILLILYAITVTIIYAVQSSKSKESSQKAKCETNCCVQEGTKCETYGCVQVAAQIVYYINESIDPCDDFYLFANGRYINEMTDETENWDSRSLYTTVSQLMNKKIGTLLKEPTNSSEWKPFGLAKNFYQSCLNQSTMLRSDNQQLYDLLHLLGGWPVVQGKSWFSRKFDLIQLIGRARRLGFDANFLFNLDIYVDLNNETNRMLRISKGNYENEEETDDDYLVKMLKMPTYFINVNDTDAETVAEARIIKEMGKVWNFEIQLIQDERESNDSADVAYSDDYEDNAYMVTTIKELQELYPYLNWLGYISAILPAEMHVTEDEPVINWDPKFFNRLGGILKTTYKRTLANYIIWRAIYSIYQIETDLADKELRDHCIDLTSEKFSVPVTLLYSRKYFNETLRHAVIDMVEDIRHTFIDMIGNVTWMENDTRTKAVEKAKNIVAHVGCSNSSYENRQISEYYHDLVMEPDNFFNNSLRWNAFQNDKMFMTLHKTVNRSSWELVSDLKPNEANAFYLLSDNTMKFPIAILHELFFSVDRPRYINYASLGNTVGHEITHGFDDDGRAYDLNGNLVSWWNSETESKFAEHAKCFVEQYSSYTDARTKLTVDGAKTLNENIADNGGTRAAYHAYQNWILRNGEEKLVPGTKYNQNQLFWISYAQAEGTVYGLDNLKDYFTDNDTTHAPDEFRVNGVVSNTEEFAKDFNCREGSKMNPTKKCRIW